jgi:hypothetical protein
MVGRGVLLEALDAAAVESVLSVGRRKLDIEHTKLRQIEHADFLDFSAIADDLAGLDACFWCIGVPSTGLDEQAYTRITYDFTMAAAKVMHERSPDLCFCFVSGAGTDATEQGRTMWARVKGKAENALEEVGFRDVVLFRPAMIKPMRGARPRGTLYRAAYAVLGVLLPIFRAFGAATSTVEVGKAMINAAQGKATKQILDSRDINELAATTDP